MPLFGSKDKNQTPSEPVQDKRTSNSLFRRRSQSPQQNVNNSPTQSRNPFKRDEDPSITAARKRVTAAEQSEKAADKALMEARSSVREAKEEVRRLEKEAGEEYVET